MNASLAPFRQAASNPQQLGRRAIKNPRLLEKVMDGFGTETFLSCSRIRLRCFGLCESRSRIRRWPHGRRRNSF